MTMDYEPGVLQALATVQELGSKDGNEHAIILRADGSEAGRAHGGPTSVDFMDQDIARRDGDVVVHNHPRSLNALSNVDLLQLFWDDGQKAAYCISKDGSVYKAERGEYELHPMQFMELTELALAVVWSETMVHGMLADKNNLGGLGIGEAHWMNRMLAHRGVIRYSYELAAETKALVKKLDEALEFPFTGV